MVTVRSATPAAPRGVILATVLIALALLALLLASFVFFVSAEAAGSIALTNRQQAQLAIESGLEEVTLLLRDAERRHSVGEWFDRPDRFQHALVHSDEFDRMTDPLLEADTRPEALDNAGGPSVAWRYSLVAPRLDEVSGEVLTFRYGLTPESGKLQINVASEQQIRRLMNPLLAALDVENAAELLDALFDWLDEDDDPRENGAESEYYADLVVPYLPKNGPLDTVEELLLVRGWSAALLYGEDVNRNGLLDPNEDDGDESFPEYDNQDGVLNHGVAPFLTVFSREPDTAYDNRPRIYVGSGANVAAQVALLIEGGEIAEDALSPQTIQFISGLEAETVQQMRSPADLYTADGEALELDDEDGGEDAEEGAGEEGGGQVAPGGIIPELAASPVTLEELPVIMERFTVRSGDNATEPLEGLININTAPARVLALVPNMTPDAVAAIIAGRGAGEVSPLTTAWPVVAELIEPATFRAIAPYITTKAYQFHAEVLGYADHTPLGQRYEYIIEMAGPLPQVRYRRDLTALGFAWPIDEEQTEILTQ